MNVISRCIFIALLVSFAHIMSKLFYYYHEYAATKRVAEVVAVAMVVVIYLQLRAFDRLRITGDRWSLLTPPTALGSVLSPPLARSVLAPTTSTILTVAEVIREEIGVRPVAEVAVLQEEIRVSGEEPVEIRLSFASSSGCKGPPKQIISWMRGQLLGSGSFGTVYEGISDDGTFTAVKEVSLLEKGSNAQQCILQLEQEIALLSQFEHENIVQYYGTDKEESKLFIFLELVTQGSLASLYQKYNLRNTQVSAYTRQILNGLNYLHERDVVHRDIKCANILVHANGSIKLADFGLAKEISKFNVLKSTKGSVYWMAPEVVQPKKTYGCAADIWSLGCTVLEMLTRQIPFPNVEWQHAFYKIGRGDQPPIPSHLSSDAKDFIRKCVQVDPNTRPTAAQLLKHPFIARRPLETYD